ncbi:MAG: DNA alkylation repair protein [bacterium]
MCTNKTIKNELRKYSKKSKARDLQRFFKTGPGEYGEGDVFIGVMVPNIRKVSKLYNETPLNEVLKLLKSKIHEERLTALLILVYKFAESNADQKKKIFQIYINNVRYINNWDLIDLTAHHIVGAYLMDKNKDLLYSFARSTNLWKRRISVLSTFNYIKQNKFEDSLAIADMLLNDKEDLIHKAVGWMLREIGNRNLQIEERFLKTRYKQMPRTMLRYAIEKFTESRRKRYLLGRI